MRCTDVLVRAVQELRGEGGQLGAELFTEGVMAVDQMIDEVGADRREQCVGGEATVAEPGKVLQDTSEDVVPPVVVPGAVGAAAARLLQDEGEAPGTDLVITGPEALSHAEVAAVLTEVTGRTVAHLSPAYEEMRDHLAASMPLEYAAMPAGMDRSNAGGAEDRTTDTVRRLTDRGPRTFRDHVLAATGGTGRVPPARVS
ncbi:hypothetical protein ACIOKD_22100 [Streptomyces sp. NPDC087844]|uniref:hypothetical protein n=1 Tax=Streptomyces sp. NPDC087844 TaxID=3365805 RepID=UPI0037FBAAF3